MNPLVKKEIRLLLPTWIAAILLAIIPTWIAPVWLRVPPDVNLYVQLAFILGFLLLGVASFGQEFGSGTFAMLLSQPVQRRQLWFVKTVVLAGAFVSVLLALLVSWTVHFNLYDFALYNPHLPTAGLLAPDMSWSLLGGLALFAAVFFSGGLWTTLLLRRISEAFWITLLTPLAIMLALYAFHEHFHWSHQTDNYVIPTVLLIYSLTGFFWARRLFLLAQDVRWTGGVIAFSSRKRNSERTLGLGRPRNWFFALVRKELQLQQVNILIAAVVLILHLASVTVRRIHPIFDNPNIGLLLEFIWMLWLAMPLLIGSSAVAEERRAGVIESQFCLPVSRRGQFTIKFFVALILSLILGGLAPFAVERAYDLNYYFFVVAAVIFFVSFYASTLARTTLQALGLTLVLFPVIYLYLIAEVIAIIRLGDSYTLKELGLILLKFRLGLPVLMLVLTCLTFGNFKSLHPDKKLWWRNGFAFLAALASVSLLIHAIYFRVWEFLMPIESPHGSVRLSASNPPKFVRSGDTLSILLPDGQLWIETLAYDEVTQVLAPAGCQVQSIGSSNWTDIASGWFETAVQSNGSIWCIPKTHVFQGREIQCQIGKPVQIGSQKDWRGVAGGMFGGGGVLVLKRDGTLWNWGTNWASSLSQILALQLATKPVQIGNETNWAGVFSSVNYACAKKNDRSLWLWQPFSSRTNVIFRLVEETNSNFAVNYASFFFGSNRNQLSGSAEINVNGELWLSWYELTNDVRVGGGKIQLGQIAKWKAVAVANESLLALRNDGTLWRWPLGRLPVSVDPAKVGNYSNWIALTGMRLGPDQSRTYTLAADGSLWVWGDPSPHVWLAPSRKPEFLGNVLGRKK
jgi:ABC-type transport system involved in multi-copper enzyme maturation permease subunit